MFSEHLCLLLWVITVVSVHSGIFLFSISTYLPLSHLSSVEEGIPTRLITSHSLQIDQQEDIQVPRTLLELEENRHLYHALQD